MVRPTTFDSDEQELTQWWTCDRQRFVESLRNQSDEADGK